MSYETMEKPLPPKQRIALEAILSGNSQREAARIAEVTEDTVRRWVREERFQAAMKAAESEMLSSVSRNLTRVGEKAISTLEAVLDSQTAPAHVKVRAADTVLARLIPVRELVDTDERIAALEQRLLSSKEFQQR